MRRASSAAGHPPGSARFPVPGAGRLGCCRTMGGMALAGRRPRRMEALPQTRRRAPSRPGGRWPARSGEVAQSCRFPARRAPRRRHPRWRLSRPGHSAGGAPSTAQRRIRQIKVHRGHGRRIQALWTSSSLIIPRELWPRPGDPGAPPASAIAAAIKKSPRCTGRYVSVSSLSGIHRKGQLCQRRSASMAWTCGSGSRTSRWRAS